MKKQKYIIIAAGIAIIIFAYISMSFLAGFKEDPKKVPQKEIFRYVKAEPVIYRERNGEIVSSGRVYSKSEIPISAEVSGKVMPGNISFKEGQSFRKGDLLIKIYDKEAGLSLKANKSSFLNSLAGILPDLKIDYPESYKDWYNFFDSIDIDKDLPELPKINSTKEKVFLASRNILSAYYNIKSSESVYKKYSIYAPFNGSITTVNVEVGGIAGINTRLGSIINTNEFEVEVPLTIEDAKWIKIGDKVTVKNNISSETWDGSVIRKSGNLDIQTQSVSVYIQIINNQKSKLYQGEYVEVYFNSLKVKDVMEIPRNAIFNSNEVFIVTDDLLDIETINIVKLTEKTAFINGLKENSKIVIEPLVNANENTKVKILENK